MMTHVLHSIWFLCRILFVVSTECLIYAVVGDPELLVDALSQRLSSINLLCVKVFQALALNASLIDERTSRRLLAFTDHAPWDYSDIDLKQLNDMADKYNIHLAFGYEVPINAGMISLVFRGIDRNNQNKPVVIKMMRKRIRERLRVALRQLTCLAHWASFVPMIRDFHLIDIVNKNADAIRHQTNFLQEIDNMDRVRENCKMLKYIRIPTAVRAITEEYPDIIVMDYIDGMNISRVDQDDYESFAKLVVKFGLVTTLIHGVTHGDLHSGNILFIKDPRDCKYPHKLGIIDFGIIHEVENRCKGVLFDVCLQLFDASPRETAEKLLNSGLIDPPNIQQHMSATDYRNLVDLTEHIVADTLCTSKQANQSQIYKFVTAFKEYLSKEELARKGVRPSDAFVQSQLALAMSHGVTMALCKHDFIPLMDQVLNELFHTDILIR